MVEKKRGRGRPPAIAGKMVSHTFRLPGEMREALEKASVSLGADASEVTRRAVEKYLIELGKWKPKPPLP